MNKKELGNLRKEFKLNSGVLKIEEIYSSYLKKDSLQTDTPVIHSSFDHFEKLDMEKKELYLGNFKKVLTGAIDKKIFELEFENTSDEEGTYNILNSALASHEKEEIQGHIDDLIKKIIENYKYETDVVVTFIKAEFWMGSKNIENLEDIDDAGNAFKFILATVNKIDIPKKTLMFDYIDKEFRANSVLDTVINLNTPLDGFMFPVITNGYTDLDKILYYASKPKELSSAFVEKVLNCSIKLTSEDEKNCFADILKAAIGDKIRPELMQEIYADIHELSDQLEETENPTLGMIDIKNILGSTGVEVTGNIDSAFEQTCGIKYKFKIANIMPDFNQKSIKIVSEFANITIAPKELNIIRQVKDKEGRKCLLIAINDEISLEGFELETEEI